MGRENSIDPSMSPPADLPRLVGELAAQVLGTDRLAVDVDVDPRCQMLAHSLRHHDHPGAAWSQYYNVALQQFSMLCQVRERLAGRWPASPRVLDFACGYGRLTRLLVHAVPAERIWAAEIQPEAVSYLSRRFGVHGLVSPPGPEDFTPDRQFDLIWVASLFSHLPESLFRRWLKRLLTQLSSDGVLCFSVCDQAILPAGMHMPSDGLLFFQSSEIDSLDREIYGATYVTESFVRAAIADLAGADRPIWRIPRGLAHEQDLYIVAGDDSMSLPDLDDIDRGTWGWVDLRQRQPDGSIELAGWAASLDHGPADEVMVSAAGQVWRTGCNLIRPDVAESLGNPALAPSGWSLTIAPAVHGPQEVIVCAKVGEYPPALLFSGEL